MIPLIAPLPIVERYASVLEGAMCAADANKMKRYLSGLMVSENKTVEGINKLFILDPMDQSTLNRLLTESDFEVERLNEARLAWLQSCPQTAFKEREGCKGVLLIDDTQLMHYGAHFEKIAYLYDHVSGSYGWAHSLVNLHYSDDQTDYPVDFRLWEPADLEEVEKALRQMGCKFSEAQLANKVENPSAWRSYLLKKYNKKRVKPLQGTELERVYKTKIDLARELLEAFYRKYPHSELPLAFDSWYSCSELCQYIHTLGKSYVGTLSADHVVLLGPAKEEKSLSDFTQDLIEQHKQALRQGGRPLFEKVGIHYKGQKETYYAYCKTHHLQSLGRQRLVISFSKEDLSDKEPKFYISNRLHWRSGGILRIRRHRWPIEVYHEEGKAEGLDQYQLRQFQAIKKHIACVCLAYSMLKRVQFDKPFLNSLQWKPEQQNASLAFWRRVISANALFSFISWIIAQTAHGQDWSALIPQMARAFL